MPVTLVNGMISGSLVGPGAMFVVSLNGATIAVGDFIVFTAYVVSGSTEIDLIGATLTFDAASTGVDYTLRVPAGANQHYPGHHVTSIQGDWEVYTTPLSCHVRSQYYHAFSLTASDDTIGFEWEPRLGALPLLSVLFDNMQAGSNADIAAIKSAVIRVFPAP